MYEQDTLHRVCHAESLLTMRDIRAVIRILQHSKGILVIGGMQVILCHFYPRGFSSPL